MARRIAKIVLGLAALAVLGSVLFSLFVRARGGSYKSPSANLKNLALACAMYRADNDERLPLAPNWMDALYPYTMNESLFHNERVFDPKSDEYGIAYFLPASGLDYQAVVDPAAVPLVFPSTDLRRNANGDLSIRAMIPNLKGSYVAFADAHTKFMPADWPRGPVVIVLDPSRK